MTALSIFFASAHFFHIICLIGFASVFGCGQFSQGVVNAMSFTATGFTLPVEMAYFEKPDVQIAFPSIARSKDAAIRIMRDLIMNAVNDVLQEQGRNALLPDSVISLILEQLNVTIEYIPLNCPTATNNAMNNPPMAMMPDGCFIIDGLVKGICTMNNCNLMANIANVKPTPSEQRTIKGILKTSNVVVANWSRSMWQSILNKVFQRIMAGRFGKYFSTTTVTLNN